MEPRRDDLKLGARVTYKNVLIRTYDYQLDGLRTTNKKFWKPVDQTHYQYRVPNSAGEGIITQMKKFSNGSVNYDYDGGAVYRAEEYFWVVQVVFDLMQAAVWVRQEDVELVLED